MTGLSKWDKPYQKEARPTTYMSIDLTDLDPPEDDPSINLHTGKRRLRENASYVALSLWGRHW